MTKSANLKFDYLVEAQAQKHLTVNNALARIDAMSQLVVKGDIAAADHPEDGEIYLNGQDLAIYLNGGFEMISAQKGWSAYFASEEVRRRFDGANWREADPDFGISRAEYLLDLAKSSTIQIKSKTVLFGVTARVTQDISGSGVTSWKIGVPDDPSRYGKGLWLGKNGWSKGLTGSPVTYWNDTDLRIAGEGGTISAGKVALYVYSLNFLIPPEV